MNDFNIAYREMLAKEACCPWCDARNTTNASPMIEIDSTGTKAVCLGCNFSRPVEAFLPKEKL